MSLNDLMKQAQKMQKELEIKQDNFEKTEYTFVSNGNAIKINMLGNKQITSLQINEDLIDPDEKEILEDILLVAINEATKSIGEEHSKIMESVSSNLKMPGLF